MDQREFEEILNDAETRLDRLRALYEQYFQGIERLEPQIPKKEVDRRIALLRKGQPRNTALRFRYQRLIQKYTTYQTYWRRISRKIEEGTYRRDIRRARQRRGGTRAADEKDKVYEIDIDLDLSDNMFGEDDVSAALRALDPASLPPKPGAAPFRTSLSPFALGGSKRPPADAPPEQPTGPITAVFGRPMSRTPPSPASRAKPVPKPVVAPKPARPSPKPAPRKPPARPAAGGDDRAMRQLYDRYIDARRKNNERVDNVKYEAVAKSLKQMVPKLQKKHGEKSKVGFDVVVKDGRVGFRPVVKKK